MKGGLYRAIRKNSGWKHTSFHMPGHKGGRGIPGYLKRGLFRLDTTELSFSDNLYAPSGPIKEFLDAISELFSSAASYFLVNGSTQGILTAAHACLDPGDKAIISSDSHISVYNALELRGVSFVIAGNASDIRPPSIEDYKAAFDKNRDAKAIIFTYPNYYGFCADAEEIIRFAHDRGLRVITDEAHGAHFIFSSRLPVTSVKTGADYVVQSMHKTLPALTQTGLLHISQGADKARTEKYLRVFGTSSPSYIFMVSAEYGFGYMKKRGKIRIEKLIAECLALKGSGGIKRILNDDPTRLVFDVTDTGMSGFAVAKRLEREYGIYAEMADSKRAVLIATVMNNKRDFRKLKRALVEIGKTCLPSVEKEVFSEEAGIARQNIVIYPPGTVIARKGEILTREQLERIREAREEGRTVSGC